MASNGTIKQTGDSVNIHFIMVSLDLLFLRTLVVVVEYIYRTLANLVETKAVADIGMSLLVCKCCPCRVAEDFVHFFQGNSFGLGNLNIAYDQGIEEYK